MGSAMKDKSDGFDETQRPEIFKRALGAQLRTHHSSLAITYLLF